MKLYLKTSALAAMMAATATILTPVLASVSAVAQPASMTAPTSVALSEATIKSLQEALNKQGIAVKVDGILTDETRAAIRKYQSQHHLSVTGEPDKATLDKLGVSVALGAVPSGQTAQTPTTPGMGPMMGPQMIQTMPQGMMGPGMMGGQGILYGMPHGTPEEMTEERVRALLEQHLTQHGNPRLRLGKVAAAADGSITAEIVTIEGSLVQKLAFNRYPGLVRQID